MPLPNKGEVLTQNQIRYWYQFGAEVGASPTSEPQYAGARTQYFRIDGVSNPIRGDISPIRAPDPYRLKRFVDVAQTEEAPDLPTFTGTFYQAHGAIPRQLYDLGECPVTFYELAGSCRDLSDFDRGWTDRIKVFSNAIASAKDEGGQTAFDTDEAVEDALEFTALGGIYTVGRVGYDIELDEGTYTSVNVIDSVYGTPNSCANCSNGTSHIYAIGANGNDRNLYFNTNSGESGDWDVSAIVTDADITLTAVDIAGSYIIVSFGETAAPGGYFYALLDVDTGEPGSWTKVTSGVTSGEALNDIYVLSASQVFFAADDGKIYATRSFGNALLTVESGSTPADFERINGILNSGGGAVIVAGTSTGEIFYSLDSGATWTESTTAVGGAVTGISVLSESRWWITTNDPTLEYTTNKGKTFTVYTLPNELGAITNLIDVAFATDEVGYVTAAVSSDYVLYTTFNGGWTWSVGDSRFVNTGFVPAQLGRIALSRGDNKSVVANNLLVAGGDDGLVIYKAAVR